MPFGRTVVRLFFGVRSLRKKEFLDKQKVGVGRGPPAEPTSSWAFSLNLRHFCCAEPWELWAEAFAEVFLLWKCQAEAETQQNKPENFAKNIGRTLPKTSHQTAPLQKENFAQSFALQKPIVKVGAGTERTVGAVFLLFGNRNVNRRNRFHEPNLELEPCFPLNTVQKRRWTPFLRGTVGTENRNRSNRSMRVLWTNRTGAILKRERILWWGLFVLRNEGKILSYFDSAKTWCIVKKGLFTSCTQGGL